VALSLPDNALITAADARDPTFSSNFMSSPTVRFGKLLAMQPK
jgi:hypothetical protein